MFHSEKLLYGTKLETITSRTQSMSANHCCHLTAWFVKN